MRLIHGLTLFAAALLGAAPATAQITGTVTDDTGSQSFTVAIPPLATPADVTTPAGQTGELGRKVAEIISNDLNATDVFTPKGPAGLRGIAMPEVTAPAFGEWEGIGAENLVHGFVRDNGDGTLTVGCYLYDVSLKSEMVRQGYVVGPRDWRRAAHKCADAIYSRLSGENPFFDSRIAYIAETGPKGNRVKRLAIMDSDGANHRFITNGQAIALTPRFSPDYKSIVYVSYIERRARVYIYDIASGRQRLVTESPNQTFSPRWSPDGKTILYSMSVGGNTDLYTVPVTGGTPVRLTNTPAIETGGSYSPDGSRIVFESDRSGSQQIYVMNADGSGQQRISFGGGTYATPEWSPRGNLIAFTRIGGGAFRIGVMSPSGNGEKLLTNSWQDEAPTWSPNGRVIQFFRTVQGSGKTSVMQVDVTGAKERKIDTPVDGSDPAWGPILP
ncbi:MAG: Tol-Pal system beta propeller repeat protein TolB [Chakrabartia godavariana]